MIAIQENNSKEKLYSLSFFLWALANLFSTSSFTAYYLFPVYVKQNGGNEADIGVMMGATAIASVFFRPLISHLVDRIGRKRSYALGCLVFLLLPYLYLLFHGDIHDQYFLMVVIRVAHGLGVAFCFTAGFTYVADIIPPSRMNEGIGMFGTAGLSGMALGPAAGEVLIREYGFSALFIFTSALALGALILQAFLKESYAPPTKEKNVSFFSVMFRRKILSVALLAVLFGVGLAAYGGFVTPYGQELKLRFITLYFICYSAAAVMVRLFGGRLADRIGEVRIIPYALFLTGAGLLILTKLNGLTLLVISGLVTGTGHGFLFPCLNTLAIRGEPVSIRGKINGVYTGGIDTGVFFGSLVLGFIGQSLGFATLFLTAGLSLLVGIAFFLIYMKKYLHSCT